MVRKKIQQKTANNGVGPALSPELGSANRPRPGRPFKRSPVGELVGELAGPQSRSGGQAWGPTSETCTHTPHAHNTVSLLPPPTPSCRRFVMEPPCFSMPCAHPCPPMTIVRFVSAAQAELVTWVFFQPSWPYLFVFSVFSSCEMFMAKIKKRKKA